MSVLVLLVGMNPLPNWVVFQALTQPGDPDVPRPDRVLLVRSDRTGDIAGYLQQHIESAGMRVQQLPLVNARDGAGIRRELTKWLDQNARDQPVHLNYTGGTKEMAVSANAAIDGIAQRRPGGVTRSYLDVEQHRLRFDDGRPWPTAGDLRQTVSVPLKAVLALHGREITREEGRTAALPPWPRTARAVWEAAGDDTPTATEYTAWVRANFTTANGSALPVASRDDQGGFNSPSDDALRPIMEAYSSESGLLIGSGRVTWTQLFASLGGKNKEERKATWEKSVEFFHGAWFEQWLWYQLHERIQGRAGWSLHHGVYARGIESGKQGKTAELDVVLISGYQLFVFSCTTSADKDRIKTKAFEVIHRAQQFGGEEARPILVAPMDDSQAEKLREDLDSDIGGAANFKVWGRRELHAFDDTWDQLLREEGLVR